MAANICSNLLVALCLRARMCLHIAERSERLCLSQLTSKLHAFYKHSHVLLVSKVVGLDDRRRRGISRAQSDISTAPWMQHARCYRVAITFWYGEAIIQVVHGREMIL